MNKTKKSSSREKISPEVELELWVKAGGRCQLHGCNEYLLEDEFTGIHPLNLPYSLRSLPQGEGKV